VISPCIRCAGRGSLDVRRVGRIPDLLVVGATPTDHMIALARRHLVERIQIVQPLLHGDEAGAVEPRAQAGRDRGVRRRFPLWVLRAVDVARQITAVRVHEPRDDIDGIEGPRELLHDSPPAVQELSAIVTEELGTQRAPEPAQRK